MSVDMNKTKVTVLEDIDSEIEAIKKIIKESELRLAQLRARKIDLIYKG